MNSEDTTIVSRRALMGMAVLTIIAAMGVAPKAALAQQYTWRNVVIGGGGGFVPGIVFSPRQPNLVYARTDIGGAYRWDNDANRWIPLLDWISFDDWNLTGVESIAPDPLVPQRVYLEVGTYTNEWTSQNGAILRSDNEGRTWRRTDLPFKVGGNMPGRSMGERLAIDPNRNSILYLGARSGHGLWRSADFGATWSQVTSFPNPGTYVQDPSTSYTGDIVGVVWVAFDPRTGRQGHATQTIYVGVTDLNTSVYRSTDGGATWAPVPGQPTGFLPHHGKLASTGMLYISYSNGAGPFDGTKGDVWKFDTSTGAWTRISPVPSTDSGDYFGYGGLAIDAQHPDTIMVAALNSWWPDTIIWRSLDGGASWSPIWTWGAYPNRNLRYTQDISIAPWLTFGAPSQPPVLSPKLGWMVGSLEIDPFNSDHMLYGTGATIYGTDNLTAWDTGGTIAISAKFAGGEETAVQDLVSPPAGAHLLSALGDIGGFRHDNLNAPTMMYTNPVFSTTNSIDFAELAPNFVVRVGSGSPNFAFSTDGGTTWSPGAAQPTGNSGGVVAAAADGSRVLWSTSGADVFFTTDNGTTWTASAGIPAGARIASDRVNPLKFYGFANGTFFVSLDGGATFVASGAAGLPPAGTSVHFRAVPGHEGDIWLAGGGLWHSTDSGQSFRHLANVELADTIGFGAPAPGHHYVALYSSAQVGGARGIYRSDNRGLSWVRINDDQHQYGRTDTAITGDPRVFGRVFVATNGRGIILGELSQ